MPETGTETYFVDALLNLEETRGRYPNLTFYQVSDELSILNVPPNGKAQAEFTEFNRRVKSIYRPTLYGLNRSDALDVSNITFFHNYPLGELRGTGTLIGFVDTGIDYKNPLFKYEDNTTRIVEIWDQSIEGNPPAEFAYGSVYTEEQINQALAAQNPLDIVPSMDTNGHGTYLAGLAAGYDRSPDGTYIGGAPEAMIAVVKLKPADEYLREYYLINGGAVAYQDNDYLAGIIHLVQVSRKLNKPLAICTGLGCNNGGHNGSTVVERVLTDSTSYENIVFVLSAGNEANLGHHYEDTVKENETTVFELNVAENEKGFIMNIWANQPDKLAISIISPLGGVIEKIPINGDRVQRFKLPLELSDITVVYSTPDPSTGDERINVRIENPTSGIWRFTIYGDYIVDGTFNAWLPREGFINSFTRFLKPESFTTVCIPATSRDTIVVGAYNNVDESVYAASGRGPTRDMLTKPDLIAPGVNVLGPWLNDTYRTYTGTSVSAAITTSACALLLEWAVIKENFPVMNTKVARSILIRGAKEVTGLTYPNNISGYGRLDLQASIASV